MSYVPYLVAAVASVMAFRLPRGRDIAVPIALVPWWALEVDVGLSVKVSEMLMALITVRHFNAGKLRMGSMPGLGYFATFMILSIVAAIATIEFGPTVPQFAGGGVMRNGYGRVATAFFKTMILIGFITTLSSCRHRLSPFHLLKTYVYSCVALAILGIIQMAIFLTNGVDIFPIAMFQEEEFHRSGILTIQGASVLRVSSLGGEPKGLGQALALALCILIILSRRFAMSRWKYFGSAGLLFVVVVLTSSTSAYVTLLIVGGFILAFSRRPQAYSTFRVRTTLCLIAGILISVFYAQAAFTDTLARPTYRTFDSYGAAIVARLTDRVKLDDSDSLVMESYVDNPFGLLFGRGLGVVHHYAYSLIPPHMAYYLTGAIIAPKSGIAHYVGNAGVLGMLLIVLTLSQFVPASDRAGTRGQRMPTQLITRLQALSFGLFATLLLRLYCRDIIWITFACIGVIQYQIQCGLISSGRKWKRTRNAGTTRRSSKPRV
ncbi:MAG: hypothetical protein MK102_18670, partial [Fuerstiella sp.]|nr:hypothetical protein [Fuerstiella sp.]